MTAGTHTILMTGATGLLGHFVLADLLARGGHRVVVLLRAPLGESAKRLAPLLQRLGVDVKEVLSSGRMVLREGSLPDALPDSDWGETDSVLACAASLQLFSNGNGEPFRTNVQGARNLADWADRHGVTDLHHVSSAYACGSYTDNVREVFHHPRPDFKTDYERTKWESELLLADWAAAPGRSLTVYRPSFLVGDSRDGYTTQFGGFYQFARVLSLLKKHYANGDPDGRTFVPLRIPGRPEQPQNFVPVDFPARIVSEVISRPEFHGRIYHLTDPAPPTNDDIKKTLEAYFGLQGGQFVPPEEVDQHRTEADDLMWGQFSVATPRLSHTPTFLCENTRRVMEIAGIEFPQMNRDRFFRLLDYAVTHHWGYRNGNGHNGNGH